MEHITDPQQELFSALKVGIEALYENTHDGCLPPEDTEYPFVYMGENSQADTTTKSAVVGSVHQTLHVWHNNTKQRGTVSDMMANIKAICRSIGRTAHYSWDVRNMTSRIIPDNTTKTPLLHGVIEADFYFS